jgi:aminopeptidase N
LKKHCYNYSYMKNAKRLYKSFVPANYQLSIKHSSDKKSFSGSVTITGRKTRPSERITLHSKGLTITSAVVSSLDKKATTSEVVISKFNLQSSFDELRLHSASTLYPGKYVITLEFDGLINSNMYGLYQSSYSEDGIDKIALSTQFESHHAREVFPCIDEPEAKATFDLTTYSSSTEKVYSNTMPLEQSTTGDTLCTVFKTTPIMSSYLLAWAIGDFVEKEARTKSGVLVRSIATKNYIDQTDFALDTAVKVLDFYEQYFEIKYPLEKCDNIAIPDFSNGAMENWGLITYRESCFLVDPRNTNIHSQQFVAMVVAHELAHQWFGNLVTMTWWTDLWLNEGFASWVEFLAVDKIFPDWKIWDYFILNEQQSVMKTDSLDSTHPVEVSVNHPDEIRTIFDSISYTKGASLIHMLNNYLGAETFRSGLVYYLQQHAYKNATTADLWTALEHVSKKPVKNFMSTWTSAKGFPLLSVVERNGVVELSQEKFLYVEPAESEDQTWPIPLASSLQLSLDILDKKSIKLTHSHGQKPILFNSTKSGFYRTSYDDTTYFNLTTVSAIANYSELELVGLIKDCSELTKINRRDSVQTLKLCLDINKGQSLNLWDTASSVLGDFRRVLDTTDSESLYINYVANLLGNSAQGITWDDQDSDDYSHKMLRPILLGLASFSNQPQRVAQALAMFETATSPEHIPANTRSIVYATAIKNGDCNTYDKLLNWHKTTSSQDEKETLAHALSSFKQPELFQRSLDLIRSDQVKLQDVGHWIIYALGNRFNKQMAWDWLKNNWDWLDTNLGVGPIFGKLPVYIARHFYTLEFRQDFDSFFGPLRSPTLDRSIDQGLEQLDWQIKWRETSMQPVSDYLSSL